MGKKFVKKSGEKKRRRDADDNDSGYEDTEEELKVQDPGKSGKKDKKNKKKKGKEQQSEESSEVKYTNARKKRKGSESEEEEEDTTSSSSSSSSSSHTSTKISMLKKKQVSLEKRERKRLEQNQRINENTGEPILPKSMMEKQNQKRLIVILERACLEVGKVGHSFVLLNCDDHATFLKRHDRDPAELRPDIAHQCLLALFDSPLNKAGLLQVYVRTEKGVLIEINPRTRIPRTFKRFCGLMVQLLSKLSIRASNGPDKLLQVIKNPVTQHLPLDCIKLGTSYKCENLVRLNDFVLRMEEDGPVVFVIGAMAHGFVEADYVDESVAISEYPLSGAAVCARVCSAFEDAWGVL